MFGAITALIIALMMIAFVIYKGSCVHGKFIHCRKSEFLSMANEFPDDCIIQIWIGRNTYEQFRAAEARRRNLRNNISE